MKTSKEMQLRILDKMRKNVENGKDSCDGLEIKIFNGNWNPVNLGAVLEKYEYRIKPETITINGVDIPKPLTDIEKTELKSGRMVYLTAFNKSMCRLVYYSDIKNEGYILVYLTKEEAIEASKLLFGIKD